MRQALSYPIDCHAIVEHLRSGLAAPAVGILPSVSWAFDPDVFTFTYDPAKAKDLLDEAGNPDPDGDGPDVRFTLSLKLSNARSTGCSRRSFSKTSARSASGSISRCASSRRCPPRY